MAEFLRDYGGWILVGLLFLALIGGSGARWLLRWQTPEQPGRQGLMR